MADETLTISGDASGAVRAIDATAAALRKLQTQQAAHSKAAADNINAWKRAASGVAPQFAGILDSMEEFHEGAAAVGVSAMKTRVALLAMASGATAAATATVAAFAAVVASSVDVIAHLEDYSDVMTRHRAVLVEAADAQRGFAAEVKELRVELAGQMSPALTQTYDAMSGLTIITRESAGAIDAFGYVVKAATAAAVLAVAPLVTLAGPLLTIKRILDELASIGKRAREEVPQATTNPMDTLTADQEAAMKGAKYLGEEVDRTTRTIQTQTAALTEQSQAIRAVEMDTWDLSAAMAEMARQQAATAVNAAAATQSKAGNIGADPMSMLGGGQNGKGGSVGDLADMQANAAGKTAAAWTSAFGQIATAAANTASAIIAMSADSTDRQIGDVNRMSATQRREMREAFRRQKAAATASALINGALAFTSALTTPPIYVGIAMAALSAVMTGLQVAAIQRQQPQLHRGGILAPDEATMSARVRRDEVVSVVPARGSPTAGDVARMSTGEMARTQPAAPIVYVVDDSGTRRSTRRHAGPSMGYGRMRHAYG